MDIVLKAILSAKLEMKGILRQRDIERALECVCVKEHATCNKRCPVFALNGKTVPMGMDRLGFATDNCSCFKDGKAMLAFINDKRKGC